MHAINISIYMFDNMIKTKCLLFWIFVPISLAPPIFISTNKRVQFGQYNSELNITVVLYSILELHLKISNHNRNLYPRITKRRVHTHDIFHGFKVIVPDIIVVFRLGVAREQDFVNYTIDACNIKRCTSYNVYLRSGSTYILFLSYDGSYSPCYSWYDNVI